MVEEEIKRLREVSMLEWTYYIRPKNALGDENLTGGARDTSFAKITENVPMRWTPASIRAL